MVTGGAGIVGRRLACGLADHGASVALIDKDEEGAAAVAAEITKSYGVAAASFSADISDADLHCRRR